nr:hypothetical protein [Paenibacillus taihuensis]
MARAVAALSQLLLQGAALDFAWLYAAFPFKNLNKLRNAPARDFAAK